MSLDRAPKLCPSKDPNSTGSFFQTWFLAGPSYMGLKCLQQLAKASFLSPESWCVGEKWIIVMRTIHISVPANSKVRIRLISFSLWKYERVSGSACPYKGFLSFAMFWSSIAQLPHSWMKKNRQKWHMNRVDNFHILRCYSRHTVSWWNICGWYSPQMGTSHFAVFTGSLHILNSYSSHEVALHLCRGCDFHNVFWCFSGLKCVWTVQMVRKILPWRNFHWCWPQ